MNYLMKIEFLKFHDAHTKFVHQKKKNLRSNITIHNLAEFNQNLKEIFYIYTHSDQSYLLDLMMMIVVQNVVAFVHSMSIL